MSGLVTLTTDFGTRDSYVAQMKAVLYSQGPSGLRVVDLTHAIEPQNVREAALFVKDAWPRFPPTTVHVVVVDPGVGSARRALAVDNGVHRMVGPDNGVLSPLLGGRERCVAIDLQRLGGRISATFHGRDVFAPAAARLACDTDIMQLGTAYDAPLPLAWPEPQAQGRRLCGEVIHVDRFGNLITNLARADIEAFVRAHAGSSWTVRFRDSAVPRVEHYAAAPADTAVALFGSSDRLEIAVNGQSACARLAAAVGDPCLIELA